MSLKESKELFQMRKWKLALSLLPLNRKTEVKVENANDLLTLRARASDFSKESEDKKVSVSLDLDNKTATVTVTKK